jgi:hypothetical protein
MPWSRPSTGVNRVWRSFIIRIEHRNQAIDETEPLKINDFFQMSGKTLLPLNSNVS